MSIQAIIKTKTKFTDVAIMENDNNVATTTKVPVLNNVSNSMLCKTIFPFLLPDVKICEIRPCRA